MMKLQDLYEKEEEKLRASIAAAKTPEDVVTKLQETCEKFLYAYNNDADTSDRVKSAAAAMLQSVRAVMPLADCDGDVRVWEADALPDTTALTAEDKQVRKAAKKAKRKADSLRRKKKAASVFSVILLLLGFALVAASLFLVYYPAREYLGATNFTTVLVLLLLSGNFFFLSGLLMIAGRSANTRLTETRTEVSLSADKVLTTFRTVVLLMDRNLERIAEEEQAFNRRESAANPAVSQEETDLFAGLIEAAYSEDGDYALERARDVKFYLHKSGIEAVDYTGDNKEIFDLMPGEATKTIRPALMKDGQLLKKGQAVS